MLGSIGGVVLAGAIDGLAERIGQTRRTRLLLGLPALPFAAIALTSLGDVTMATRVPPIAFTSALCIAVSGYVCSRMAHSRYVDSITDDDPIERWHWEPASVTWIDGLLVGGSLAIGLWNALGDNLSGALLWITFALLWVLAAVIDGRWYFTDAEPELRVHDAGLVKKRPYTKSLVPWSEIVRVRLTHEELILDRRLLDLTFERDAFDDPEAVRVVLERQLIDAE